MTEIVPLFGGAPEGHPDPEVIAMLEMYLERAKRGEIAAVAIASVSPYERHLSSGWSGQHATREALFTSIAVLQRRMMDSIIA
jgi:hypothetical protein